MRTVVVCKCKAPLRRRDGDLKLVEHVAGSCDGVLELSGGLRWVHCRVFVNPSISAKMCAKTVTVSAFGWRGDGFTEQCPWPKRRLFCATALIRPGFVIVARKCKSTYVSTSRLLVAGKQYSRLGKEQWSARCGSASFD